VHISDAARIELEGLLQQRGDITVDSFDRVQHELFDLMNVEFSMFLSSEFCRQCLHELEKEENLKDLLEKSEMI
jgi:hypothetical protein